MFKESSAEIQEKGMNVKVFLKFIRHGERDTKNNLLDYGRDVTKHRAQEADLDSEEFDAVKAIGSDQGPKGPTGMARAKETADIYAKEIAGEDAFTTRTSSKLNFETIVSKRPYDHVKIYNSFLPENFNELSDQEKSQAAKIAQTEVVNHLLSLTSPEAITYKKEVAGSHAAEVLHNMELAKRLKSGSQVLRPAGTHGGNMELFLQQALVRENENGEIQEGFKDLEEIGGDFDPSEAFTVDIETDMNGDNKELLFSFDNKKRPSAKKMYLDKEKIIELAEFYKTLHQKKEGGKE